MLLFIIRLLLTWVVNRTSSAIWHLHYCRRISHGLLWRFFISSRLTRINLRPKSVCTPFQGWLNCRLTLLLERNIVMTASAVAVAGYAILSAGKALAVKFETLGVPTVATFARTLVHINRHSCLTQIGELAVLSRIWKHLVLGVNDLPIFWHRGVVRTTKIWVLTWWSLEVIISKKGRSLAYTSHQDGLIDLRPGYRVYLWKTNNLTEKYEKRRSLKDFLSSHSTSAHGNTYLCQSTWCQYRLSIHLSSHIVDLPLCLCVNHRNQIQVVVIRSG